MSCHLSQRICLLLGLCALLPASVAGLSSAPADAQPQLRRVFLVAPHILVLRIEAQERERTGLEPYRPEAGDEIRLGGYDVHERFLEPEADDLAGIADWYDGGTPRLFRRVFRGGEHIGHLAGRDADILTWMHRLVGTPLDDAWADSTDSYRLRSPEDDTFQPARKPSAVYRKSRPRTPANTRNFGGHYTQVHDLYLVFADDLAADATYELTFRGAGALDGPVNFRNEAAALRSDAIQVNQNGYHPAQDKLAFLSTWMGAGGGIDYGTVETFELIDAAGTVVHSGRPQVVTVGVQSGNLTEAPVAVLDFSTVRRPGTYRVVVPGIGCSHPVTIAEDVWETAFQVQMKGFLHQRSGIAVEPPMLPTAHPRDLHPDDGYRVHRLDEDRYWELYTEDQLSIFDMIQETLLFDDTTTVAWGGWRDAGDWDRQAEHMDVVGTMAAVWESDPTYFEAMDLGIPESGDGMPDILDEALWGADCFRRAQRGDGAVPGYIESIEHPRAGELAHLESLPMAWVPPRLRDNLAYAANAAYLAWAVERYDADRAADLRDSAIAAFDWVLAHPEHPSKDDNTSQMQEHRALLGAALYRMTGRDRWHRLFLDNTTGRAPYIDEVVYIKTERPEVDTDRQEQYRGAIVARAGSLADRAAESIYRSIRDDWPSGRTRHLAWPQIREIAVLVAAQMVAPEERFARAIENAYLFALGANPMNLVHITGLGQDSIWPFDKGWNSGWLETKPIGQMSPGYEDHWQHGDDRTVNERAEALIAPEPSAWPDAEFFFPQTEHNEHTVQGMQVHLWGWAWLAQHHARGRRLGLRVEPLPDPPPRASIGGVERQLTASGAAVAGLAIADDHRLQVEPDQDG